MDPVKELIELYLSKRKKYLDSRGRIDPVKEIIELYLSTRKKNTLTDSRGRIDPVKELIELLRPAGAFILHKFI